MKENKNQSVVVENAGSDDTEIDLLGSAVKSDYMELMLSRPVLEKVIENLNLNKSVKQLQKMISITNKSDTRILQITTTSTDPQLATDVANELATQAILMLPEIMENEPPNLVSTALFPTAPAGPSIVKNTLLGAILGLVLCGAVLVVIFLSDRSFKDADAMQKYFGMMPLAVVPSVQLDNKAKRTHRTAKEDAE